MNEPTEVLIALRCFNLPGVRFEERTAVRLGVQKDTEIVQDVSADADSVTFDIPLRVAPNAKSGEPNFLGPYAHGTPEQRFIYLTWGEFKDGNWDMFRRAKIQLGHLTWNDIRKAAASSKSIHAEINMTDKRGGPLCASVKPDQISWDTA